VNSRTRRPELMDDPALPLAATARALADLETVHRWTGNAALWRLLLPLIAGGPPRQLLLDVGTGNGAVASEAVRRAAARGVELRAIGLDRKLAHLVIGHHHRHRQLRVAGDATALPFAEAAVDVACSTLFQHHFTLETGSRVLAEMRRVSRRGAVVVDLRCSRLGGALGRLVMALLRLGPVARYDGRLSLAQSWTLGDVRRAAPAAATRSLRRCWPFRWALELAPGTLAEGTRSSDPRH
jgi:SAM-dependent methyltransferase